MTYPDETIRLIERVADARIKRFAESGGAITGATSGTIANRTGPTTCMCTLSGSNLAVPVKVFGDVEVHEGDRVGLLRIGADWTVVGTFSRRRSITMPDDAGTGMMRMVWGSDTPTELSSYGINNAMIAYVTDDVTGIEVGYFFIGVSNLMDGFLDKALVFGNVTYTVPGNPSTATIPAVKTNFQMNMWAEARRTTFKDHIADMWWPANINYDGVTGGRGLMPQSLVITTASGAITAETVICTYGSVLWRQFRAYAVKLWVECSGTASSPSIVFFCRRTNLAGALRGAHAWTMSPVAGNSQFCYVEFIIVNTGADVTDTVVISMQLAGTGTVSAGGSSTSARRMQVWDIGSSTDYVGAINI